MLLKTIDADPQYRWQKKQAGEIVRMSYLLKVPKFCEGFQKTLDFIFHEGNAKSWVAAAKSGDLVQTGDKVIWTQLRSTGFASNVIGLGKSLELVFSAPADCTIVSLKSDYNVWVDNRHYEHIDPFVFRVESNMTVSASLFYASFFSALLNNRSWIDKQLENSNFPYSKWAEDCFAEHERVSELPCVCLSEEQE